MKLYATTTSERASKGQGGNTYIITDYYVGTAKNSQQVACVELRKVDKGYTLHLVIDSEATNDDAGRMIFIPEPKSQKAKNGEICIQQGCTNKVEYKDCLCDNCIPW